MDLTTTKSEKLVYVRHAQTNNDGTFVYEFYFSEEPENVWGLDWDIDNPSSCENTLPEETTYSHIYKATTNYPLTTIQENSCYSIEHATYGIIALAWINIENLEVYPENGRMVFHFNDSKEKVEELLSAYDYILE